MSTATVPPAVSTATTTPTATDVKTFRGESLEELLPQIREELGPDAVILRQRDGLSGGVAGFFQKRCVEIDARAGTKRIDTYAGADEAQARAALDAGDAGDEDASAQDFDARLEAEIEEQELEERFSRPAAPAVATAAPAAPPPAALAASPVVPQPAAPAVAVPAVPVFPAAGPAIAEGMQAPAIQALFDAAVPFAEQLQAADAALAPELDALAPELSAAPSAVDVAEAQLPAPAAATAVEPAGVRPAQADTQELALVQGGLSPALAADVVAETVSHLMPFGSPRGLKRLARTALARRIPVAGPRALGGATVAFAGAGGSGKTLSAARLAAAYAANSDLRVVVLALRPRDGGAELRALLAPAGVEVEVMETAADAQARIAEAGDRTLVVIDTPAVSPGDEDGVRALASDLRRIKGTEVQLCVPATLSAAAGERLVAALQPLRPAGIVLTHVDETPTVGAIVELSIAGGPPLSFVGRDTQLEGGLALADPADIAALVLA
jgi:flagellar biosynthesis protein FlhF